MTNFNGNQHRSSLWIKIKNFVAVAYKRGFQGVALLAVIGWSAYGMSRLMPPVYAEKEVVKEVKAHAPVMDRIAKCESGNTHYDKSGQVLTRGNTNKTVDIGRYQINTVWHKKATELGLDITKEKDNEKMAYFIYENHGTSPWVYSSNCWDK